MCRPHPRARTPAPQARADARSCLRPVLLTRGREGTPPIPVGQGKEWPAGQGLWGVPAVGDDGDREGPSGQGRSDFARTSSVLRVGTHVLVSLAVRLSGQQPVSPHSVCLLCLATCCQQDLSVSSSAVLQGFVIVASQSAPLRPVRPRALLAQTRIEA